MKTLKEIILEKLKISSTTKISKQDLNDPNTWIVGDILAGTYGYNMTIPKFYKVIKKTAKQFTVVKLSKKLVSGHYNGSFEEIPDESKLDSDLKGKEIRVRINKRNNLVIDGTYVRLWDGKPMWGNDMD